MLTQIKITPMKRIFKTVFYVNILQLFVFLEAICQVVTQSSPNQDISYVFPIPDGWSVERTPVPPPFSPNVPYKGFEEIHFPPGWANKKSENYWTVSYLFRLEGRPKMNAATLQKFLNSYFEGLIADNVRRRNIPKDKPVPVNAALKKDRKNKSDGKNYIGTIASFDYLSQVPLTLNCKAHIHSSKKNITSLFIEISPKPYEHAIWQTMEQSVQHFKAD